MPAYPRHFALSFNAGELSPRLHRRIDLAKYRSGCKVLENFVPLVFGGATRRAGTRFVGAAKYSASGSTVSDNAPTANEVDVTGWTNPNDAHSSNNVYATAAPGAGLRISTLWKTFGFSIPVGNVVRRVRVLCEYNVSSAAQDSRLEVSLVIGGTTIATKTDSSEPLADTQVFFEFTLAKAWAPADFSDANLKVKVVAFQAGGSATTFSLDEVRVLVEHRSTTGEVLNGVRLLPFEFSDVQAYALEFGEQYMRVFRNGGVVETLPGTGMPFELSVPYFGSQVAALKVAQSADTMYVAHPSYEPRKITRTADNAWTIASVDFIDGPYFAENTDTAKTLTVSLNTVGTGRTMTASGTLTFNANQVGALWRIKGNTTYGYVKITAFTSSTVVTVEVKTVLDFVTPGTSTTSVWREGLYSTHRGFPRAIALHESRLVLGGSNGAPQRFDGSAIDSLEDFTPGTAEDDAYSFTVFSGKVNTIQWLASTTDLLIGTLGDEYAARTPNGEIISPVTPPSIKPQGTHGSGTVSPVRIGNVLLFVQRAGRKLWELGYNFDTDSYLDQDSTLLAEHLTKTDALTELAYQEEIHSLLWAIREDGQLCTLVYDRRQDVAGWARQTTDGKFLSVAVIPHPDGDRDQVWCIAERTINAATWRYVEYFDDVGGSFAAYKQLGVDSGLTYSGAAATTLSGLAHLEGKSVEIVGNGFVYPNKTVSGGQITGLDPAVTTAEVGLGFDAKLETLSPAPPVAIGLKKHRATVSVSVHDTVGCTINGKLQDFRKASDPMDLPVPPFTGEVSVANFGWENEGTVTVEQTQPLPATCLAIHGVIDTGD